MFLSRDTYGESAYNKSKQILIGNCRCFFIFSSRFSCFNACSLRTPQAIIVEHFKQGSDNDVCEGAEPPERLN